MNTNTNQILTFADASGIAASLSPNITGGRQRREPSGLAFLFFLGKARDEMSMVSEWIHLLLAAVTIHLVGGC